MLITQEFTTEKHSFNLAIDVFVEAAYKNLSDCLVKILNKTDFDDEDDDRRDVGFAAYYALSLICKKEDNVEGLGEQMHQFFNFFSDNQVFTHKFKENGPDGTDHFDAFVDALLTKFPQIIIGD